MTEPVKDVVHKHLFTPGEWCMRPYCARFGLTKEKMKESPALESMIMDQYVRDCGYEPSKSWAMIVHPSGKCEYTPLQSGERWCCEEAEEIGEKIGPAEAVAPPYERVTGAIE